MKKTVMTIVCAVLIMGLTAGCGNNAKNPAEAQTPEAEEADEIAISGNQLVLTYDSNPTTGCSWIYQISDESVIKLADDEYVQDKINDDLAVGVGGHEIFTFKALKKGKAVIALTYGQQWKGGDKDETKYVNVEVDDDGNITSAS